MNIYDTKQIHCTKCDKFIGEIEYDAEVVNPLCGHCANPLPEGIDDLAYSVQRIKNMQKKPITHSLS